MSQGKVTREDELRVEGKANSDRVGHGCSGARDKLSLLTVSMLLACFNIPPSVQRWMRRNPYALLPFVLALALFTYHQTLVNPWAPSHTRPTSPFVTAEENYQPPKNEVLLVSAFYPSSQSKHSATEYRRWLTAFLGHIATDVYLYVPPYLAPMAESLRPPEYKLYINISFATPFDVPPLLDVQRAGFEGQQKLDREQQHHGPQLYAVLASKAYFLSAAAHATRRNGYRLAFWVDADSFRAAHAYKFWPDASRFDEALATTGSTEDSIFIPMDYAPPPWFIDWKASDGPADGSWSEGAHYQSTRGQGCPS